MIVYPGLVAMKLKLTQKPRRFLCAAFTYGEHAKEFGFDLSKIKKVPLLLLKSPDSVIWNNEPVMLPDLTGWFDAPEPWGWVSGEVEIGVVMKDTVQNISEAEAEKHILGYTIFNDVTQRDLEKGGYPYSISKSFPTFGPCGPVIVTPDEIPDPQNLRLTMKVSGKVYQNASSSEMNVTIFRLVSIASKIVRLEKDDIISTGTPPGCLAYRLKDGDVMEAEIEGIGVLRNPVKFKVF